MIRKCLNITSLVFISALIISCSEDESSYPDFIGEGVYSGLYFPTNAWRECSPDETSMDADKLKLVYDYCASENRNTFSFIIIKDGYINSVDDFIADYFPQLQEEGVQEEKKAVSIKHLLTMTSGFQWNEDEISFLSNDLYKVRNASNYVQYVLDKPIVEAPGTVWNYSSGMPLLLGGIVENATNMLTLNFAEETLFADLRIKNVEWNTDPEGHTIGAWGLQMKTRNYAKLGCLYGNGFISEIYYRNSFVRPRSGSFWRGLDRGRKWLGYS